MGHRLYGVVVLWGSVMAYNSMGQQHYGQEHNVVVTLWGSSMEPRSYGAVTLTAL